MIHAAFLLIFFVAMVTAVKTSDNVSSSPVLRRFLQKQQEQDILIYETFVSNSLAPCYPCGPTGFTTTPNKDISFIAGYQQDGQPITCGYLHDDMATNSVVPESDCPYATSSFSDYCDCASAPTTSPAPTISPKPTILPSTSPSPTISPCFLCNGDPNSTYTSVDYGKEVDVPALGGIVPCWYIQDYASWGIGYEGFYGYNGNLTEEGSSLICDELQVYAQDCGCPPIEPTASPAPTVSPPPSLTPSVSPAPSAAPCFFCGDEHMYSEINYDQSVNVPGLGGIVPCWYLQDYAYWGLTVGIESFHSFYGNTTIDPSLTCEDLQVYGKECDCPQTEPTLTSAPTGSSPPSVTPPITSASSVPCSCQGFCNGPKSECSCWCDSVCESYGDCCGDLKDYCEFDQIADPIVPSGGRK